MVDTNDSICNLTISAENLKKSLFKQKHKSSTLSLTENVIRCVGVVLSEYGEESIKRHRFKNNVTEIRYKDTVNKSWTCCIKSLEELVTSDRELDRKLCLSILTLISQVQERQSLRITNNLVLHEVILKWIAYMNHVDLSMAHQYTRCLASFILGNLTEMPKDVFSALSGTFFRLSQRHLEIDELDTDALETLRYCVSGLTNLCYLSPTSDGTEIDDFLAKRFLTCGRFFHLFVLCLERLQSLIGLTQMSMFRMQHQCLHGLNYVCQRPHGLSPDSTERLLAVLRVYCGFGMFRSSGNVSAVVTTDMDDPIHNIGESADNGLIDRGGSDESYLHEEEIDNHSMRKWEVKTRRLALELLLKVLSKSWKKIANDVWLNFMPPFASGSRRRFNLMNVLDRERDISMKVLVLRAIQQCIVNCKDLLFSAQHQAAPSNFVSRSHSLACVIDEIHERLLNALTSDKSVEIQIEILRCLLALIRGVLYHRLRPSIVNSVVRGLRQVLLNSNRSQITLRCVVLDCFTALVGFESVSNEMRHLLLRPSMQPVFLGDGDSLKSNQPSWLLQLCVRLAHPTLVAQLWTSPLSSESWGADMDPVVAKVVAEGDSETDATVRCQALMTVGAMLSQHGSLVRPSLDTLKRTLMACLHESLLPQSANAQLRSHVLRVFSGFLGTLENKKSKRYVGILQDSQNTVTEVSVSETNRFLCSENNDELCFEWWSAFLDSVVLCLRDSDDSVRASAAQCMSLMSESVLDRLVQPHARQEYYRILLDMFQDPSVSVCCQAVWALGYWVAMRPLNVNLLFIGQLIAACHQLTVLAIEDSSVYVVCANATWSLSNAIEVLVAHKESLLSCCKTDHEYKTCQDLVTHYLADVDTVHRLLTLFCGLCSLRKAGQAAASARIHENAIRGLGFLCRFIDGNLACQESIRTQLLIASETFCKAIQLPDKAGRVKVKWNACLSASHIFRNRALIADTDTFRLSALVDTLVGTVATDRYFKVRNNSLMSLLTLLEHGGRVSLGLEPGTRLLGALADACVSVTNKCSVPFSEVHRHCLCLYLLKYSFVATLSVLTSADLVAINRDQSLMQSLSLMCQDHVPTIWQQLHHLNRSFNKQTLLTHSLTTSSSVEATTAEVDRLLAALATKLDTDWSTITGDPVTTMISGMIASAAGVTRSLSLHDHSATDTDYCHQITAATSHSITANHGSDNNYSDDDGLLTKRPGASLIFSQIYD